MRAVRWIFRRVRDSWCGTGPKSLFDLAREPRRRARLPTSKLYVIEADFEIQPDTYESLQAMLGEIREKYGLDFMLLEPGFRLKRFDDY